MSARASWRSREMLTTVTLWARSRCGPSVRRWRRALTRGAEALGCVSARACRRARRPPPSAVSRSCRQLALVAEQGDSAAGPQDEVGDAARGPHRQLEVAVGRLADELCGGAVEQQGDIGAGRLFHLAQHQDAGLRRALPVDVAERLARLMRPDSPELRGAEGWQAAAAAPVVPEAHVRVERARIEKGDAGEHGDHEGIADLVHGPGDAQRVLGDGFGRREDVDSAVHPADVGLQHLLAAGSEALDLQLEVARSSVPPADSAA